MFVWFFLIEVDLVLQHPFKRPKMGGAAELLWCLKLHLCILDLSVFLINVAAKSTIK